MENRSEDAFNLLFKPIRRLIKQKGFLSPTLPQKKAIPKILEGKNILLIAPTATGKTEAAVLPILNMLIQMPRRKPGIKVLYVTPLRALNRDILERLQWWCNNLDVKLSVRHGDTSKRERVTQARSPPDMLITTPETLQAILPGRLMRRHLQQVKCVVVDEVHEMADNKRGSQLSLALERLRWLVGREFQIVGLSATIGTPEKVAQFLVGNERSVEIVKVPVARLTKLKVLFPKPSSEDHNLASTLFTHPDVAARLRIIRQHLEKHKSALLFTNTRSLSEVLASRFKVWNIDLPVSIHHGSLAKPSRIAAERGLKNGELKGLVCTSSLELGIDIGRIDFVIQYMSPRQVTRIIQRVGRSGHRIGRIAEGIIITMDSDDTLEAMVIAKRTSKEDLEAVIVPFKPYDVLAHQIAGLLMKKKRWYFYEIYDIFKNAFPYTELTLDDVKKVMTYMHSRFPRLAWVSFEDTLAMRPRRNKALYEYYFENLSMIPYEKQYLVIDDTSDSAVGILDEAFMAEYGKPGVKFIIRGTPWKIIHVSGDKTYVKPVDDPTGAIPSWMGEEIPVPFDIAQEVGWIRGFVEKKIKEGKNSEEIVTALAKKYPAEENTVARALVETIEQVKKSHPVPSDQRIVLENWEDYVILHANFGTLTNRALAQLISRLLSEQAGYAVTFQHDPYRILIQTVDIAKADSVATLFNKMKKMSESQVRSRLTEATVKTGLFKRRMIHVARRFGALRRWVDFSNISLRSLMKSFEGTVIYDEALKECFTKDLDVEHTLEVLDRLRKGQIEIKKAETAGVPTPIAQVGIERVSMKTDLISPEKMRLILIKSTRARLLNETRTFICTSCWDYLEMIEIKDLPANPMCPVCGSTALGVLDQEEEKIRILTEKRGEKLAKSERKMQKEAFKTAGLISEYGKPAALALCGRRLRTSDVKKILHEENNLTDRFFELIIEAEKEALKKKFL